MDIKTIHEKNREDLLKENEALKEQIKEKDLIIEDFGKRLNDKTIEERFYRLDSNDERIKQVVEVEDLVHGIVKNCYESIGKEKDSEKSLKLCELAWRSIESLEKYRAAKVNCSSMDKFTYPKFPKAN